MAVVALLDSLSDACMAWPLFDNFLHSQEVT